MPNRSNVRLLKELHDLADVVSAESCRSLRLGLACCLVSCRSHLLQSGWKVLGQETFVLSNHFSPPVSALLSGMVPKVGLGVFEKYRTLAVWDVRSGIAKGISNYSHNVWRDIAGLDSYWSRFSRLESVAEFDSLLQKVIFSIYWNKYKRL